MPRASVMMAVDYIDMLKNSFFAILGLLITELIEWCIVGGVYIVRSLFGCLDLCIMVLT